MYVCLLLFSQTHSNAVDHGKFLLTALEAGESNQGRVQLHGFFLADRGPLFIDISTK